jgi:membrane glycosyltransferase
MPAQDLRRAPGARAGWPDARVLAARATAFGGAAALTAVGFDQMTRAFDPAAISPLQVALRVLFVATFAWIAFSATSAVAGLLFGPRPPRVDGAAGPGGRVAIVMPVYNEDAAAVCGALAAMGAGLARLGAADRFEIFLLSDTRDPDAWARETTAFAALRETLAQGGGPAVWYRRRAQNAGRKAGNVQDFVERWGGRYEHMAVLDADSLMAPETLVEMARRMDADPGLALLQSAPSLIGGVTPFARLQQFAGALYGPVVARGVAAWAGPDGNFWGHNALIRTRAFAEAAGLPELPGRRPFGGHVLSHDFVEAALLRRAGWRVRMDPDLSGSWEGSPPSLLAAAARDRRWAQGNVQHLAVVGAAGLRWPSRVHFAIGVLSYAMSPLWLGMLTVGVILAVQATLWRPEYFPEGLQLFPTWPRFDAERMTAIFAGTFALLFLPKVMGFAAALLSARRRRAFGGGLRLTASVALETALSALYAPTMMLMQCRHLLDIALGRDSGWAPQTREGAALAWRDAAHAHGGHVAVGLAVWALLWTLRSEVVVWLSPVIAGLVLAPFLSRWGSDPRLGAAAGRVGLLATPEEVAPPPLAAEAADRAERLRVAAARDLAHLGRDDALAAAHTAAVGPAPDGGPEAGRLDAITARAKIAAAASADEALRWLSRPERAALAADPALMAQWRALSSVHEG